METAGIFTKKTHRPHTHRLTTHMLRGLQHTRRLTYTCSETHVHISSQAYMHKCSWAQACTFHKFTCLCTPGLYENTLIGYHVYTFMVLHTLFSIFIIHHSHPVPVDASPQASASSVLPGAMSHTPSSSSNRYRSHRKQSEIRDHVCPSSPPDQDIWVPTQLCGHYCHLF